MCVYVGGCGISYGGGDHGGPSAALLSAYSYCSFVLIAVIAATYYEYFYINYSIALLAYLDLLTYSLAYRITASRLVSKVRWTGGQGKAGKARQGKSNTKEVINPPVGGGDSGGHQYGLGSKTYNVGFGTVLGCLVGEGGFFCH